MKKTILVLLLFISVTHARTILFLGDSLTEGYGLNKEEAYPSLVERLIESKLQKDISVINGGVSGSTTNDAIERLKWYLKKEPDIIFIALGANDGLRGYDLKKTQENFEKLIELSKNSGAKVLLAGMLLPPNYGEVYRDNFKKVYLNLKDKYELEMMPFLLKGVAGKKEYNQSDGIHPNEKGHKIIARDVFEFLKGKL